MLGESTFLQTVIGSMGGFILGGGLGYFIFRNIYQRIDHLENTKANVSTCEQKHKEVDRSFDRGDKMFKEIRDEQRTQTQTLATLSAQVSGLASEVRKKNGSY